MGSFRPKIPNYWKLQKGTQTAESTSGRSDAAEDQSSLKGLTTYKHGMSLGTYVESIKMDPLDASKVESPEGITIRRDLSSHSETL